MGEGQTKNRETHHGSPQNPANDAHPAGTDTNNREKNQMQLEGVRISWASKDKVNTGCESCQWVGKGAVQASPRRGLARGVPNGTIMGENRGETK